MYYIIIVNLVGFFLMYIDKKKSINHKWRIRENTLILVSIIGGSIGCFLGMYTFRHKTKHLKFKVGIPIIILVQVFIYMMIR